MESEDDVLDLYDPKIEDYFSDHETVTSGTNAVIPDSSSVSVRRRKRGKRRRRRKKAKPSSSTDVVATDAAVHQQFQAREKRRQIILEASAATSTPTTPSTPIIVVPSTKSILSMSNAKEVLQDLRYVSTDAMRVKAGQQFHYPFRRNELQIHRRSVPYTLTDNPTKLTRGDWDRVVAVFVIGPEWQFKGWPWDGNPTIILTNIKGFHLKWDEDKPDKNIGKWPVTTINLSKSKRHLDRGCLLEFWNVLERHIRINKPHLKC